MVATKWKVTAGAATLALALGAGSAIAQTTTDAPTDQGTDRTQDVSADSPDSADSVDSADTGDSADSPDTP